jgi:hypothetical protein
MTDTITIEFKKGISRVVYNGKEMNIKTAWLKKLTVNDLFESTKQKLR